MIVSKCNQPRVPGGTYLESPGGHISKVSATQVPKRPQLVFRIGITGARCLKADQRSRIRQELAAVLKLAQATLSGLSEHDRVVHFYQPAAPGQRFGTVRVISPLAKGADRLAAQVARDLGCPLDVPMPFPQPVYEKDFKGKESRCPDEPELSADEDLAEFRGLLAQASGKVMLDGARNCDRCPGGDLFENQSYEAVGHYVVRHCDLLLAVWNGAAGGGRGGTQEIVEYAARTGVPIWWIHATQPVAPRWIADKYDLRSEPTPGADAANSLALHLARLVPAPAPPEHTHRSALVRFATTGQRRQPGPAAQYFRQTRLPSRRIFKTYKNFMKLVGWSPFQPWPKDALWSAAPPPATDAPAYWFRLYEEADARAGDYTVRYRSSYVLVILLAALSLVAGSLAEYFPGPYKHHLLALFALPEVVLLGAAVFVLWFSIREDWHLKSVEYRLLAELFRKQKTLATLGWALSVGGVEHLADSEGLSWVAWLLAATQRASPFPHCEVDDAGVTRLRVDELRDLLKEQIEYHEGRRDASSAAAEHLEHLGAAMFVLLALVALLRIPLALHDAAAWHATVKMTFGILAVVLPSLSAAFLAIRSYAELQLLAEQSRTMIVDLGRARTRLLRLDESRPLASQVLGEEAGAVATLMLQELDGWGRIFRGKLLEMP